MECKPEKNEDIQPFNAHINFVAEYNFDFANQGEASSLGKNEGRNRNGLMKFGDFSNPDFYAGMAINQPENYSKDDVYWFRGIGSALREDSQVKAYLYPNAYVVTEAIQQVKTGGTFLLLKKVIWGKTDLWKGQLGKITIKQSTTIWKL